MGKKKETSGHRDKGNVGHEEKVFMLRGALPPKSETREKNKKTGLRISARIKPMVRRQKNLREASPTLGAAPPSPRLYAAQSKQNKKKKKKHQKPTAGKGKKGELPPEGGKKQKKRPARTLQARRRRQRRVYVRQDKTNKKGLGFGG